MEYIGEYAFYDCGIEEVVLPDPLKEIDENAFKECGNLKTIWLEDGCVLDIEKYFGSPVQV